MDIIGASNKTYTAQKLTGWAYNLDPGESMLIISKTNDKTPYIPTSVFVAGCVLLGIVVLTCCACAVVAEVRRKCIERKEKKIENAEKFLKKKYVNICLTIIYWKMTMFQSMFNSRK
ncbi:hypothetical protein MAR_021867 [Mya arenaria]|uniref:Uncharacterized protein n=1 Tax=Mya arenaria TaxID=6604 RepID=A0ABY7E8W7_MYAAR|nr:hypothetical protein MAR_021867 [Mya arenaria]